MPKYTVKRTGLFLEVEGEQFVTANTITEFSALGIERGNTYEVSDAPIEGARTITYTGTIAGDTFHRYSKDREQSLLFCKRSFNRLFPGPVPPLTLYYKEVEQ